MYVHADIGHTLLLFIIYYHYIGMGVSLRHLLLALGSVEGLYSSDGLKAPGVPQV